LTCRICGEGFKNKYAYYRHKKKEHSPEVRTLETALSRQPEMSDAAQDEEVIPYIPVLSILPQVDEQGLPQVDVQGYRVFETQTEKKSEMPKVFETQTEKSEMPKKRKKYKRITIRQEQRTKIAASQKWKCNRCVELFGMGGWHTNHILRVALGGTNERSNLEAICHNCHAKITAEERIRDGF